VHLAGAEVTRISHDELGGGPGTAKGSGRLAGGMGSRRSSQTSGLAIGTLSCAVVQVCGTVPAVGLLAD